MAGSQQISNWNAYYASVIETAYRFLGAFIVIVVVLYVSSGLVSGLLVTVKAPVWRKTPLNFARWLGPILIVAAGALLPVYAMFRHTVITNIGMADTAAPSVLLGVFVVIVALFLCSQCGKHASKRETRLGRWRESSAQTLGQWWPLVVSLIVIFIPSIILWFVGLENPHPRLVMSYIELVLLSVVTTSVSFGQSRKIQVSAKSANGKHDEAATAYLLARMMTLGIEQPRQFQSPVTTKALSDLTSTDLSASPAGQVASVMARLLFAIRPGLAWHASVTLVDDNRLAMTVSRNGRLATAEVFAREEDSLRAINMRDKIAVDRARAQLLTGAAAFTLLHLGTIYPELREGMCGAKQWRSVALQVIACSASLSGLGHPKSEEDSTQLLSNAANQDPHNLLAEFYYIRYIIIAKGISIEAKEALLNRADKLRDRIKNADRDPLKEYDTLIFRVNYLSAYYWLHTALERECDSAARKRYLKKSLTSTKNLINLCEDETLPSSSNRIQVMETYRDVARWLGAINGALTGNLKDRHASEGGGSPPALAYNYACFEAERLQKMKPAKKGEVCRKMLDDLAFATGTERFRDIARVDPSFTKVRHNADFVSVVGRTPIPEFLGLEPYKNFSGQLEKIGYTSATRFAAANGRQGQRAETAAYLGVPSAAVDQMYEFAVIGERCPELADPRMLHLLLKLEVDSWTRLHAEIDRDRRKFVERLRKAAADDDLEALPAVTSTSGWVTAVAATSHRAV